jgi:hypothetical protein
MARLERFASENALLERDHRFESGPVVMLQTRQAEEDCSERCDGSQSRWKRRRYSDDQDQPSFPYVAGRIGKLESPPWSDVFRFYDMISATQRIEKRVELVNSVLHEVEASIG